MMSPNLMAGNSVAGERPASMPNFLIIGAAKAGTTSLHRYLNEHPQVFMSAVKEPRFFAVCGRGDAELERIRNSPEFQGTATTLDAYQRLFEDRGDAVAVGEASPLYLVWSETSARSIHEHIPDVRLIAILRDPVERAFSHYKHNLKIGVEGHRSFEAAMEAAPERCQEVYLGPGFYARHLEPYYVRFPADHIRLYEYREFTTRTADVVRDLFTFLGVDPTFQPQVEKRHNVARASFPKNLAIESVISRPNPLRNLAVRAMPAGLRRSIGQWLRDRNRFEPVLRPETRSRLVERYREDVERLQDRMGRDLSSWLRP